MKKIRKNYILAVLLILSFGLAIFFAYNYYEEKRVYNNLLASVESNGEIISMKEATDFEWDTYRLFSPYTPIDRINESLGFEWDDFPEFALSYDENYMLVFVKDNEVVEYFILKR